MTRALAPLLLFTLFLCTCDSANSNAKLAEKPFYDLAGYIDGEVKRLSSAPLTAVKTITLNGKEETQELAELNYADDLKLFAGADINKPAWVEKYATETEKLSGRHQITRYTALDSSLTTQLIEIEEDRGQTQRIHIVRKTGTILSKGRSEMVYQPASGYNVTTKQENRFGGDINADVSVRWK